MDFVLPSCIYCRNLGALGVGFPAGDGWAVRLMDMREPSHAGFKIVEFRR